MSILAKVMDEHNEMVQYVSGFLLEVGMPNHKIKLIGQSKKATTVLWLARRVLANPSYHEWLKRSDTQTMRVKIKQDSRLLALFTLNTAAVTKTQHPVIYRSQSAVNSSSLLNFDFNHCK